MFNVTSGKRPGENPDFQYRLLFLAVFIITAFIILLILIGKIQIIQSISYSKKSKRNREKIVRTAPARGKIFSADNKLLADNKASFSVFINQSELYKNNALRQKELLFLSDVLKIDYLNLETSLNEKKAIDEVLIKDYISFIEYLKIIENLDNLPGIAIKEILYRDYPNKDILAHVLGYTGPINMDELAIKQKQGYEALDNIGKNGIEKYYEDLLRGKPGEKVYSVDARMVVQEEIESKEVKQIPGYELVLTINLDFQKNVEEILADRVGSIVAVKPATGEILAMASYPDYDPNIYILNTNKNRIKKREMSLDTKRTPLLNRNIQSVYPPGSVYKIIATTAILNEDILSINDQFYCNANFRYNNEYFKCWVYPAHHGWQNLIDAIENSCDVYFYNAGLKVGPERLYEYAVSYGFGSLLNIDLSYEKEGRVPSVQWMKSRGKTWLPGYTLNTSIGQGDVEATPLQISNLMSVIANKGYSFRPHILKEVRNPEDGGIVKTIIPEKIIDLKNYKKELYDTIQMALRRVITNGTAANAFYRNTLKLVGKTGTAEVGGISTDEKQTHSWFAGYGPIDYPIEEQIAVVVLIEQENNNFYRYAAPIANMVFNSWFNKEDFQTTAKRLGYPIKDSYYHENNQ